MPLRVDTVGTAASSLAEPKTPLAGAPELSPLGTWAPAVRRDCMSAPRAEEACVPGGAFWMGHPYGGVNEAGADASVSRLVVLRPFFMDQHEVTVGEYRASGLATAGSDDPQLGPGSEPAGTEPLNPIDNPEFFCTYSSAPLAGEQSREAMPVNCISWEAANAFCEARGKRLPSEAEYEYVAGALRSELFVWGSHDVSCPGDDACPACLDMVWGRGGFSPGALGSNSQCRVGTDLGGAKVGGSGLLDRLTLGRAQIVDLMGNLNEWTRDYWNRIDESCWQGRPLLENPECRTPSELDFGSEHPLYTVKGQAWDYIPFPAAERRGRESGAYNRGFRCVRSDD